MYHLSNLSEKKLLIYIYLIQSAKQEDSNRKKEGLYGDFPKVTRESMAVKFHRHQSGRSNK